MTAGWWTWTTRWSTDNSVRPGFGLQTDFALSTFAFWREWLAWGLHPGGYHAVNMLLHALSAVLLWRVLAGLGIPGAWVAGAVFAVHPVSVISVARIAELKNTMSLPFFLLSLFLFLPNLNSNLNPLRYALSLIAFVLALMSKTSTIMLPVILLSCALWVRGRITREDLLRTGPFFLLALAFGLMSAWFQKHQALAGLTLPPETFWNALPSRGASFGFIWARPFCPCA